MDTPTSDSSDQPRDTRLADMANNLCGIIKGGVGPALVASRLESLGWKTWSASWYSYEAEASNCQELWIACDATQKI
ncbi:hypothetical protein ACIPWE_24265 [Streptomyces sp. NPDC090073]|uniref:hypothetical protein n=1 Tax=Streptomyces sp. NPDC090073 TaxID=3365936 RepID=UPI0038015116